VKPRYMYPGCWIFPRVTSLAFGIGTNSKAQHMIAHGQDDQEWQHLLRIVISGYVICWTGSQQRHLLQQQFLDSALGKGFMQKACKVFKLVHPGAIKRKQILTNSMTSHNNWPGI
jgi:hypothetical protein